MTVFLVIDDSAAIREMVCNILRLEGRAFLEAADGEIGLRLFKMHRPDFVITDLVMPNMEGIETIREIRRLAFDTKIIAMTGSAFDRNDLYLRAASQLGADETLEKPFEPAQLRAIVNKLINLPESAL